MRRLVENQAVTVQLDSQACCIDCAVGTVCSPVAMLAPIAQITPGLQESLTVGALGFLTFEFRGSLIALRGAARTIYGGAALEFVVVDGVQMTDRRSAPRVRLQTPVHATPKAERGVSGLAVETVTVDLSIGGALLTRRPGLGHGPWRMELFLPDDTIAVRCAAVLARQTPNHLAIKFSEIPAADLVRLAGVIADHEQLSWP
jgi:hypothetical protein